MPNTKAFLCLPFFLLICLTLSAQQKSKTKAANKLYEKGAEVQLSNAAVNSADQELAPIFYGQGLLYPRQGAEVELLYTEINQETGTLASDKASVASYFPKMIGAPTLGRNGKMIYFTQRGDLTPDQIYEAQRGKHRWKDAQACSFNATEGASMHPSISFDQKTIYFASNRPGGFGGFDLYMVERTKDGWSEAQNLGETINTAGDEVFPFIHSSGNLLFASDGYDGVGGKDLYMVERNQKRAKPVVNLGEPFNSTADDYGLILRPEGTTGFFVSNREGGQGKTDIYNFEVPTGLWGKTKAKTFTPDIEVMDEATGQMITGASIRVFERSANGAVLGENPFDAVLVPTNEGTHQFKLFRKATATLAAAEHFTDKEGICEIDFIGEKRYLLLVSAEGYADKQVSYATLGNRALPALLVSMDPVATEPALEVAPKAAEWNKEMTIVLNQIRYDFPKSTILVGGLRELDELASLLLKDPSVKIEIGAHTDSRGAADKNQAITESRAQAVRQYLVDLGIATERIRAVGYGENNLRNHCQDGVKCEEEAHEYNQRLEVKVQPF